MRVKFGEAYSLVAIVAQFGYVVLILEKLREYGDISLCKNIYIYLLIEKNNLIVRSRSIQVKTNIFRNVTPLRIDTEYLSN